MAFKNFLRNPFLDIAFFGGGGVSILHVKVKLCFHM